MLLNRSLNASSDSELTTRQVGTLWLLEFLLPKVRSVLLPPEPFITFPRLSILGGPCSQGDSLGVGYSQATGSCTPPARPHLQALQRAKAQATHARSCQAPKVSSLPLLSPRTFSRPSSFRLMMSRSKSVRKPLVLLKTIRPVNPSH